MKHEAGAFKPNKRQVKDVRFFHSLGLPLEVVAMVVFGWRGQNAWTFRRVKKILEHVGCVSK